MPDDNLTLREFMEVLRAGLEVNTRENIALRSDVHDLREANVSLTRAVESLTVAIRGNGSKGLVRVMDAVQESQASIVRKMEYFETKGTPASQMEFVRLREKDLTQDTAIAELKGRLDVLTKTAEERRWQITLLTVSTLTGIVLSLIGVVFHFLQPKVVP